LKHILNYEKVWRLPDVPDEILIKLNLKRRDMGIDIICENNGLFAAVQCKYKKHTTSRKHCVTWKELSTFYALCLRSGLVTDQEKGWGKYIVMTNCEYITHMGKKTEKDLSICIGSFRNITKDNWIKMCNIKGNLLKSNDKEINIIPKKENLTSEELREKRLKFYKN
jgi:predicted helicase